MPKNIKQERYRWIKPVLDGEITAKAMSKICPFSYRTIKRWKSAYLKHGINGLRSRSTRPKRCYNETPIRIKERIIEFRKETKLGAQKLHWKLLKERINIHPRTINKIVKQEGLTRKHRVRKIKHRYVRALFQPGELVEIDIKYVPQRIQNKRCYQFTAIDCASRWRYLKIYEDKSNGSAREFLQEAIKAAPFKVRAVKTDNDSCFTNRYTGYLKSTDPFNPRLHVFDLICNNLEIDHFLIDPGKPAQNGKVERSHRTDQEMFYNQTSFKTLNELKSKIKLWNMYYNDLEHCGLNGLTPNQALRIGVQNVHA